jgi:hypothetical protein
MMSDEDIREYHNIRKKMGMKKSNKYNYIDGKQITDPDTGKRVYEISSYRLPSVTTILGATKNTEFLTKWKAKVGEERSRHESRMYLVHGAPVCINSSSLMSRALVTMILQNSDARRVPWPIKLWRLVLRQWKSIMVPKLRYIIRAYTQVKQTLYVYTMILKLLLTSSKLTVRRRKNGSKIIIFKSQRTPWHTTMSTGLASNKELSWYARLTYIIKSSKSKDLNLRRWKHQFLKRLDMYHDLIHDEKEKQHQ